MDDLTVHDSPFVVLGTYRLDHFPKKQMIGQLKASRSGSGQPIWVIINYPLFCPSFSRLDGEGPDGPDVERQAEFIFHLLGFYL